VLGFTFGDSQRVVSFTETAAEIPFRCGFMQCNESTHSETVLRVIVYSVLSGSRKEVGRPFELLAPAT